MSTIRIFKGGVSSFVLLLISAFLICSNAFAADFWPRFKYKSVVRWRYAGGTLPQVLRKPANMSIEVAIDTAITRAMRTMQDAVRDTYGSGITIQKATGLEYDIQIGWEDYPPCTDPSYLGTASTDTGGVTFARIFINNQLNWTILGTDPADGCTNYYDLQTTLLHEIGHTFLGVGNEFHADDPTYVMYGPYVGRKTSFQWGEKNAIRALYNGKITFRTDFGGPIRFKPGAPEDPQLSPASGPPQDTTLPPGWVSIDSGTTIFRHPYYADSINYVDQHSGGGEIYNVFKEWWRDEASYSTSRQTDLTLNDFIQTQIELETNPGYKTLLSLPETPAESGTFNYTLNDSQITPPWDGFVYKDLPATFKCLGPDPRWKPLEWRDTTGVISNMEELVLAPTAPIKNLRAVMKAHLGSTLPTVTSKTNQRKTAYVPSSVYFGIVYESADQIWAGTVLEEPSNELMETRVSNPSSATLKAKSPSLAYDRENRFYLCWQETEDLGGEYEHRIYMRPYNTGMGSEGPAELVAVWNAASNIDAVPSISYGRISGTGDQTRMLAVFYKTNTGLKLSTRRLSDTSWATISIPFTGNAVNASVALEYSDTRAKEYGHLVYELNGHIRYYRVELYNWPTMTLQNSANLSAEYDNFLSNSKPTIALKPSSAYGMDTMYVAWEAYRESFPAQQSPSTIATRQGCGTTWQPVKTVNHSNHAPSAPVISYDNVNNKLGLIFQCASHAGFSQATPIGSNWNWQAAVNIADDVFYPQGGLYDNALHVVWTTGTSSPYWIDRYLEANPLAKSAFRTTVEPEVSRSATLAIEKAVEKYPVLSPLKGRVHVRLSSPYTGESKSRLEFAEFDSLSTQSDWLSAVAFGSAEPVLADVSVTVKDFAVADRNKTIPYSFPVLQNTTLSNGTRSVNTLLNIGAILLKGESSFNSAYILQYGTLPGGSRVGIDLPEGYLSGFVSLTEEYFTPETDSVSLGKETAKAVLAVPVTTGLLENYPNPFNPETEIRFGVETPSEIMLSVYDLLGREVTRLKEGQVGRGMHSVRWNATTNPSGVYIVRLTARSEGKGMTWQKKILLLK